MNKGIPAVWRDAVRDSELDRTAKTVGFVLSTYLNAQGRAFPSLETLGNGASISSRAVYPALVRLERHGFLSVTRSRNRRGNRYQVTLPGTANAVRHSEWGTATEQRTAAHGTANGSARNSERRSPESALKRGKATAAAADFEVAASANGKKGSDEGMDMPFLDGMRAKAFGEPYWELFAVRTKSQFGESTKDKWLGVFASLEAAEAERDRLERLDQVNGDYLEIREMTPRREFIAPREAT